MESHRCPTSFKSKEELSPVCRGCQCRMGFPIRLEWLSGGAPAPAHVGWESRMGKSNVTDPHKVEWDRFPWPKASFLWSKMKMHSHGRLAVRGGGAYRCAGAAALGRRCVPLLRAGPPRLGVPRSGEPAARVASSQSPCEHARPGAIRRQDGTGKRLASIFRVPPDAYARSQRSLIFSKKKRYVYIYIYIYTSI